MVGASLCDAVESAILNRPAPSLTQPPPGRAFDVVAFLVAFVLSVLPWWQPPPPIHDDADLDVFAVPTADVSGDAAVEPPRRDAGGMDVPAPAAAF